MFYKKIIKAFDEAIRKAPACVLWKLFKEAPDCVAITKTDYTITIKMNQDRHNDYTELVHLATLLYDQPRDIITHAGSYYEFVSTLADVEGIKTFWKEELEILKKKRVKSG